MKEIKFEDWLNYDKRLGKIIIAGLEGYGKDLLTTAVGVGKMLHGFEDCIKSYAEVDSYNAMGFHFSKNYDHTCFANFPINCKGTEIPQRKVYVFNPYRCGFYDPDYWTDLFPPRSLFCGTEAKSFLDAYEWQNYPNRYVGWIKTLRHIDYDMLVNSQVFGDICVAFKRITNRFVLLTKETEEIKNTKGDVVGHKLFVKQWTCFKDFELFEKSSKEQNCDEFVLILSKCYYENYDHRICRLLHLRGREDQDFKLEHFPDIKTIDDVEAYAEVLGFDRPEGFLKNSKKEGKKNKEEDVSDLDQDFYEF